MVCSKWAWHDAGMSGRYFVTNDEVTQSIFGFVQISQESMFGKNHSKLSNRILAWMTTDWPELADHIKTTKQEHHSQLFVFVFANRKSHGHWSFSIVWSFHLSRTCAPHDAFWLPPGRLQELPGRGGGFEAPWYWYHAPHAGFELKVISTWLTRRPKRNLLDLLLKLLASSAHLCCALCIQSNNETDDARQRSRKIRLSSVSRCVFSCLRLRLLVLVLQVGSVGTTHRQTSRRNVNENVHHQSNTQL